MKALSVRAPWWYAILHLGKDIENRDWSTNFRGKIYLHAGKFWKPAEIEQDVDSICLICNDQVPDNFPPDDLHDSCGCIVGTVDIVGCVSQSKSRWFFGEYGFQLANPVAFHRPISFKGALGFFDVPDDFLGGPRP